MIKKISPIFYLLIILVLFVPNALAAVDITAEVGNSVTIYNVDFWGKNDNDVSGMNFSQASVDPDNKIVRVRAYSSYSIPFISPNRQVATGFLTSRVFIRPGTYTLACKVRVTFNGSYNGLIGSLGIAAGKVELKGIITRGYTKIPVGITEHMILETGSGGLPSGDVSGTFNKSFETNVPIVGESWGGTAYCDIRFEALAAAGTSTLRVTGVCDNDFYTGNRNIKLNWIKVEILGPDTARGGGGVGKYR